MKPYYQDEKSRIVIYHCDNRELLADLPKHDLILTDPPYGIGHPNPACVNPAHLFLGNVNDNNQDMKQKGRHIAGGTHCGKDGKWPRGLNHHAIKINEQIVREIRALKATHSYSQLSKRFGLALGHLNRIVSGKAWGHVK